MPTHDYTRLHTCLQTIVNVLKIIVQQPFYCILDIPWIGTAHQCIDVILFNYGAGTLITGHGGALRVVVLHKGGSGVSIAWW